VGNGLPGLRAHLRVGKHAQHRRAELGGDLNPSLDPLNVVRPRRFIRGGEVVADARSADSEPKIEGVAFELENEVIGRDPGSVFLVTGKVVPSGIEAVETLLRAKISELKQTHAGTAAEHVVVEEFAE